MKEQFLIAIYMLMMISCTTENSNSTKIDNSNTVAELNFIQKVNDFGTVPNDTILVSRYYFTNTSTDTLKILRVKPDCTCTEYFLSKKDILPKDTAYIELVFNTKDRYGDEKVYAIVEANTVAKMYKLTLKASIH